MVDIPGTDGADTLRARDTADRYHGMGGNDIMSGGGGNDWMEGQGGNDWMDGGSGYDTLYGGVGQDTMYGGEGRDWLNGGSGADRLVGGPSQDRFVFSNASDANADAIVGFRGTEYDIIDLLGIDAVSSDTQNQDFMFKILENTDFTAIGQLRRYQVGNDIYLAGNTDRNLSTAEFTIKLEGTSSMLDVHSIVG